MRKFLLIGATALAFAACQGTETTTDKAAVKASDAPSVVEAAAKAQQADANVRLNAWFETKFMENARRHPQYLARLGIKERMDEWNDPSRAFALEELDRVRQDMKELKSSFNPDELDESSKLSYRLFLENSQNVRSAFRRSDVPHQSTPY